MKRIVKTCSIVMLMILVSVCFFGQDVVQAHSKEKELLSERISKKSTWNVNGKAEEDLSTEEVENLKKADTAFSNLWGYFNQMEKETKDMYEESYSVSGVHASAFPKEYAGAYINENLDLVILFNEKIFSDKHNINEICNKYEDITESKFLYDTVKFSYYELINEMEKIREYISENSNNGDAFCGNISSYEIDDYNNCVNVYLKKLSEEWIDIFVKCISQSAAIKFYSNDNNYEEMVAFVRSGEQLSYSGGSCSIGFPVRKYENGSLVKGFVTAGHAVSAGATVYWGGQQIATADNSLWQNSGSVDAVFCKLNSTSSILNQLGFSNETLKNAIDANLAVGHPVKAVGHVTQGSSGTVISMSASASGMQDLVKADYICQYGDSGGIVASTRTGSNYIAGIITSRISPYSYYTKATNIMTAFGLTLNN